MNRLSGATQTIGMVAGEPSGDLLAGRVIAGLRQRLPGASISGIGGPHMLSQGFDAWHDMHALTVFGFVDALKRMPSLLSIYTDTKRRLLRDPPAVFVGIDAPDFNLRLERELRRAGTPTVHFVGPSIWAWRYERIHKIRESVSHMLVLFPFEEAIYCKENIPVTYVGHPLAQTIPMKPDRAAARARLGLDASARVLAILPGSRASEIRLMSPRFLQAAQRLARRDPRLQCIVPMVNAQRRAEFEAWLAQYPVPNLRCISAEDLSDVVSTGQTRTGCPAVLVDSVDQAVSPGQTALTSQTAALTGQIAAWAGQATILADQTTNLTGPSSPTEQPSDAIRPIAWLAMEAADAVLVTSGTATLETALYKRPMVISYVLSPWMRRIMAWKSGQERPYLPWVGLPNILLRDSVVPELLQDDATVAALEAATWNALTDDANAASLEARFTALHQELLRDTPALAAEVIANCCMALSA